MNSGAPEGWARLLRNSKNICEIPDTKLWAWFFLVGRSGYSTLKSFVNQLLNLRQHQQVYYTCSTISTMC